MHTQTIEDQILNMPMAAYMAELGKMQQASKRDPRNAKLNYMLGLMYLRTDSYPEAVRSLKKASKTDPNNESVLKVLSEVTLLEQKDYSEALKHLKRWSMVRPDVGVIHAHIAECLLELNKPTAALESVDKAEAIDPDNPKAIAVRANIYTKIGDVNKARETLERYLDVGDDANVASGIVDLPGYKPDDTVLERLENMVERLGENKAANVIYSNMGKVYESRGDYDRAFEYLVKSNEKPRERLDKEEANAAFKNIREVFTRKFMLENAGLGHESDQPIFIVGMPRSGTTLTESILAGHPKVTDNGELPFMQSQLKKNGLYAVSNPLLANKLPGLKEHFEFEGAGYFKHVAERYFDHSGFQKRNKKYQVDKLPHNFLSVGLIHLVFPNAKIIHCRRHPVDCALSCYKASFSEFHAYATDLEFLGVYYKQYFELMKYWRELLPGRMFEVCYEDVVANTELVARNMIDHIGLDWDDGCLDHTKSKKTVKTASQWQVRQPIYTSSVAKWKHYEKHLQPMIKTMGSCIEEYEAELAALAN